YYGMEVTWSILTGFPQETDADFRQQIDLIRSITHLQPPISVGDIWLERFSPYFSRPEEYGVTITGPGEAYPYVYDGSKLDLMKIAYDFEFTTPRQVDPALVEELRNAVDEWKARHRSENIPFLFYSKSPGFVTVYDNRFGEHPVKLRFEGAASLVIDYCNEAARTQDQMRAYLKENGERPEELEDALKELQEKRIVYTEGNRTITLPLPHNSRL
ncbi:MAG: hypothetical protein KDD04_10020, partial [Sinomicrobium sp.]|nr:hypothetical protein [Sinomicrobium sp.]